MASPHILNIYLINIDYLKFYYINYNDLIIDLNV